MKFLIRLVDEVLQAFTMEKVGWVTVKDSYFVADSWLAVDELIVRNQRRHLMQFPNVVWECQNSLHLVNQVVNYLFGSLAGGQSWFEGYETESALNIVMFDADFVISCVPDLVLFMPATFCLLGC